MEIVKNSKARFEYEILEEIEAGIVLAGSEVKSLRLKKVSLVDSYAKFKGNELFLVNARIEPYTHGSFFNHDPVGSRKLLLKKKELFRLKGKLAEKGWTIIPLKMYFKDNKIVKVLLGLCRGKKAHDKRQSIKDKDLKKEALRELKHFK
ncbi:MAG: SsrA-binding protein SmpB [Spirochaetia bacterium]|nr:SsrA-binding protein SmpB [Spirochaetia bacterium]